MFASLFPVYVHLLKNVLHPAYNRIKPWWFGVLSHGVWGYLYKYLKFITMAIT